MKLFLITMATLPILVFMSGCGSTQKDFVKHSDWDAPVWFLSQPTDSQFIYAAATATSLEDQLSLDKAASITRTKINKAITKKLEDLQNKFQEEIGSSGKAAKLMDQFTSAAKVAAELTLNCVTEKEKKVYREGNIWRAYILVKLPASAAAEQLIAQISKNNDLYKKFSPTQTFKDLEKEIPGEVK